MPSQSVLSGSSKLTLYAAAVILPQIHQDLVLDAAGSVGGQLDVLVGTEGIDGLDEPDGTNGDQVLDVDASVLEPAGNIDHQPQVPLDEGLPHRQFPLIQTGQKLRL